MNPNESTVQANSPHEAIDNLGRQIRTSAFRRNGISKVRVVSRSILEGLIAELVDIRLRTRVEERQKQGGADVAEGQALVVDEVARELVTECKRKWSDYQLKKSAKLRRLEKRLFKMRDSLDSLRQSIERVVSVVPPSVTTRAQPENDVAGTDS